MKMASWALFVLVFDTSGEPAAHPGDVVACLTQKLESEFEVGRATFCNEEPSASESPPMGFTLSLQQNSNVTNGVRDYPIGLVV